jgi:hypothetical protein
VRAVVRFFVEVLFVDFLGVTFTVFLTAGLAEALRVVVAADATLNGFVFFGGAAARTCLIALTCSSSVIRNS